MHPEARAMVEGSSGGRSVVPVEAKRVSSVGDRPFLVRKVVSVVLALGVIAAACIWVSAVRFKDDASYIDCGTPIQAARHGQLVPRILVSPTPAEQRLMASARASGRGFGTGAATVTVCAGEARARLAISAAAIVVAVAVALLVNRRRRWGRAPLPPVVADGAL
jgi:hypothetical protein